MIDDAVFPVFSPGMICLLVPPDTPGVVVDEVDRVADVVVQVTDDEDHQHEQLQAAVDQKVFGRTHRLSV